MSSLRIVKATSNGPMQRLIGSLDVDGHGTEHELASLGLFVLLDDATVTRKGLPDFGFHPHSGASILSIPIHGGPWISEIKGDAKPAVFAPGSVAIAHTGRGIVHDEVSYTDEESSMVQLAMANFENDEPSFLIARRTEIVQDSLWLLYDGREPDAKVWFGSLDDASVWVRDGLYETSWLYARADSELTISGRAIPACSVAVLEKRVGQVEIGGRGEFLLGTSEEPAAPPEKILFGKGFSIARTSEAARGIKARWETQPW